MFSFFKSRSPTSPTTSSHPAPHPTSSTDDYDSVTLSHPSHSQTPSHTTVDLYPPPRRLISHTSGYPPLDRTFATLASLLDTKAPFLLDTLNSPALPSQFHALERLLSSSETETGFTLPRSFYESYSMYNGQDAYGSGGGGRDKGLFYGLWWMSLEEIESEWIVWRKLERSGGVAGMRDAFSASTTSGRGGERDDKVDGMSSFPPGWVREVYSDRGWIPLLTDHCGNYIGLDLSPPPSSPGQAGQIIAFGREIDQKTVLFPAEGIDGWGRFVSHFVEEVGAREGGEVVRLGGEQEEGDSIGERDYFDGDRYGEEGEEGMNVWHIRDEYRQWLALDSSKGGLIGALAERSKRRWRDVGVGIPSPPPEGEKGTQEEVGEGQGEGEEFPPEVLLSPPSPKIDRFETPIQHTYEDDDEEHLGRPSRHRIKKTRPPPPPPAFIDLPSIGDLYVSDSAAERIRPGMGMGTHSSAWDTPYAASAVLTTPKMDSSPVMGGLGTPTREALLSNSKEGSASTTMLVPGQEGEEEFGVVLDMSGGGREGSEGSGELVKKE